MRILLGVLLGVLVLFMMVIGADIDVFIKVGIVLFIFALIIRVRQITAGRKVRTSTLQALRDHPDIDISW